MQNDPARNELQKIPWQVMKYVFVDNADVYRPVHSYVLAQDELS